MRAVHLSSHLAVAENIQEEQRESVERDDGSYLVNQWYQWPVNGLWYYMGADGYMLTNAMTPDGLYVDGNGIWNPGANAGFQQAAVSTKDVAAIRQVVDAYKDWAENYYKVKNNMDSFVFVDIDGDGLPECIATNEEKWIIATHHGGKVTSASFSSTIKQSDKFDSISQPFYVPGKNVLCEYRSFQNTRTFYEIDDDGGFVQIGRSLIVDSSYRIPSRSDTSKAIYDEYNNSFGQLVEISLKYEDTYRSIDAACDAYLAQ